MAIDYIIDLECDPKAVLSTEGIVHMIKAKNRAETIIEMARRDGDQRPPSEITFSIAVNRNGEVETTDVAAQDLLDQAAPLDDHRGACANCPANRDNPNGYGCYESINYPLEADTERFLLARLPDKLDSAAGYMFASAMRDFAWDGAGAADMRSQGETFFRLRKAPERTWPDLKITGDQMFHMLFHVGHLQSAHSMMLCLFFGLLEVGEGSLERETNVEFETKNAHQMLAFMNALAFAAANKVGILVDG